MFGMIRLREVRHKYTYTVHWQFGDSPSTDRDMSSVRSSTAEYICLPICLWVCLFVYQNVYCPRPVITSLPWLKHKFFRDVPKSKAIQIYQHKENMWWWLWARLVTQVVSASVQCSKGFELEQKKPDCMYVCLPQAYYPLCLNLDF